MTIIITDINMARVIRKFFIEVFARIDIRRPVNMGSTWSSATVRTIDGSADVRNGRAMTPRPYGGSSPCE